MILQEMLFPNYDTCPTYDMYFRLDESDRTVSCFDSSENTIFLPRKQRLYLDTYFNSFSVSKWRKYTNLNNLTLQLDLKGDICVQIYHKFIINGQMLMSIVEEKVCHSEERASFNFELPYASVDNGMFSCGMRSLSKSGAFYGGRYITDADEASLNKVDIAIDICTFKRETFVERNIALLNAGIIENPESPMYGHLDVFVSDNGKTLDVKKLSSDRVHISPNKNVGGAGGFARGMIEIIDYQKKRDFSHALVMDDDVLINIDAIVRTYRFLQFVNKKYADKTIAGAMLRLDQRHIQHECCGVWDGEMVHSRHSQLNLCNIYEVLKNDSEDVVNFNAWWYSCIPMSKIGNDNLPLPIFIRFDDVEFGLRTGSDIISLTGVCLWHEPFEYKYSSSMEYYHMRNCLIINAYHKPGFDSTSAAKHMLHMVLGNLIRYRYNNCELIFRAVDDFCKGTEFLLNQDGEALHKEIMAASDKFLPLSQLDVMFDEDKYAQGKIWHESRVSRIIRKLTFNGLLLPAKGSSIVNAAVNVPLNFYHKKAVLNYDVSGHRGFVSKRSLAKTISIMFRAAGKAIKLKNRHAAVCSEYRRDQKLLTSRAFWNKYLSL